METCCDSVILTLDVQLLVTTPSLTMYTKRVVIGAVFVASASCYFTVSLKINNYCFHRYVDRLCNRTCAQLQIVFFLLLFVSAHNCTLIILEILRDTFAFARYYATLPFTHFIHHQSADVVWPTSLWRDWSVRCLPAVERLTGQQSRTVDTLQWSSYCNYIMIAVKQTENQWINIVA